MQQTADFTEAYHTTTTTTKKNTQYNVADSSPYHTLESLPSTLNSEYSSIKQQLRNIMWRITKNTSTLLNILKVKDFTGKLHNTVTPLYDEKITLSMLLNK